MLLYAECTALNARVKNISARSDSTGLRTLSTVVYTMNRFSKPLRVDAHHHHYREQSQRKYEEKERERETEKCRKSSKARVYNARVEFGLRNVRVYA